MATWRKLNSEKALEHDRKWRAKNRKKVKQFKNNYKARYPLKFIAQQALTWAVSRGKIIRPKACSNCSSKCKPEGHHPDYSKPLSVIWLCRPCHLELHCKQREEAVER